MPASSRPTVPSRVSLGGLTLQMHDSSDMPQISEIGTPSPAKKPSVRGGIGAAPDSAKRRRSKPSFARSFESTSASALAHSAATSSGTGCPASWYSLRSAPTASAHRIPCLRVSSGSFATTNSMAAASFSHTRGTAPQMVGRRSASAAAISFGSDTVVTWVPNTSWR